MADPIDLTPVEPLVNALLDAEREADKWDKVAEVLKRQIKERMGAATHATCNGTPVFTWRPVGKLNVGSLKEAEPELYQQYYKQVTVWELDKEALQADHPDVYEAHRSRVFNRLVK